MFFNLGENLLLKFEFYDNSFACEYKELIVKFYFNDGLISNNFESALRLSRSPRSCSSQDDDRSSLIEEDIFRLVDGSIYKHFSDDSHIDIHRIVYFFAIYSFILICEKFDPAHLKHETFKRCLFFFFIMKEGDYHVYGKDWPLFESSQYEDRIMNDSISILPKMFELYGDKLQKYAHVNSVYSNDEYAKSKMDLIIFYFETKLGFCMKDSKTYVDPHMIDAFLFGVFKQINPEINTSYAVFNRYLSMVKEVDRKLRSKTISLFEKKMYRFYLSFYVPYFDLYSQSLTGFLNNIVTNNLRLRNDYANALIHCLLELNYFASVLKISFNQKCLFLNVYFKSPINLITNFNVFQWKELYHGKTRNFLFSTSNIETKLFKECVKYDLNTIEIMKHTLIAHLATFKLNEADHNFYREIIVHSKNEFELINNLYNAIKNKIVSTKKHIFLILFFSVLNHLKNIFMLKMNNIYVYCLNRYHTHSQWHRHIYEIAKLWDPVFKLQKKDIIENYDANLFLARDYQSMPENLHYLFQTSVCIFFMLQKYYFNIMKKCSVSTRSIYALHLVEFDEYKKYMTYSEMIYPLYEQIKNLTPRKKSRRKLKNPQLNLSKLTDRSWESYFYYRSENKFSSAFIQQKTLLLMKKRFNKIENKK